MLIKSNMKTINLSITGLVLLILVSACNGDKKIQLSKLKVQQTELNDKIKNLENELQSLQKDELDTTKFKFIGLTTVERSPFDHFIRVQGKLDGDQNAAAYAEVPGTVIAKYADVGQKVVKGQVLAQIDDQQYRKQMQGLETQYKFAEEMFEKQQRLWDQKIGSEVQYLQAKTSKESLDRQIASLKEQLDKFKIKAPINGTIEECSIKVGGVVAPDPRLAAYRIVEFKNLKVSAEVSEAYSTMVHSGDKLNIMFPDANKEVEASVSFVSSYINPVNRTFLIETKINSSSPDLKANMIAIVQINDFHTDSAIQIPMNIIQNDMAGTYVYVVRSKDKYNVAYKQPVVIGNSYNGVAEIIEGLSEGDKVITIGYQEIVDGEYVRF